MEENKLNSSELKKLIRIYDKLQKIDDEVYDLRISNNVRDGIIMSIEEIRRILNQYNK
jgi:hypothetical protein